MCPEPAKWERERKGVERVVEKGSRSGYNICHIGQITEHTIST